jgi:hypothetical protein
VARVGLENWIVHSLFNKGVTELQVLLIIQPGEVEAVLAVLGQLERLDESIEPGVNQVPHLIALKLLDRRDHEWKEKVLQKQFTRVSRVLNSILFRVFCQFLEVINELSIVVHLQDSIDDIVQLLKLSTESTLVMSALFVQTMDFQELRADDWGNDLTLVNEESTNLIPHLCFSLFFSPSFSFNLTHRSSLLLTNTSVSLVCLSLLDFLRASLESFSVFIHAFHDTVLDELI